MPIVLANTLREELLELLEEGKKEINLSLSWVNKTHYGRVVEYQGNTVQVVFDRRILRNQTLGYVPSWRFNGKRLGLNAVLNKLEKL